MYSIMKSNFAERLRKQVLLLACSLCTAAQGFTGQQDRRNLRAVNLIHLKIKFTYGGHISWKNTSTIRTTAFGISFRVTTNWLRSFSLMPSEWSFSLSVLMESTTLILSFTLAKTQVFVFFKCTKNGFFFHAMFVIDNDRLTKPNPNFIAIGFCKDSNNLFVRICFFEANIIL